MNKLNSNNVVFSALKRVVEDSETWELVCSIDLLTVFGTSLFFFFFLGFMATFRLVNFIFSPFYVIIALLMFDRWTVNQDVPSYFYWLTVKTTVLI